MALGVGRSIGRFGRWVGRRPVGRSVTRSVVRSCCYNHPRRRFIGRSIARVGRSASRFVSRSLGSLGRSSFAPSVARSSLHRSVARSLARVDTIAADTVEYRAPIASRTTPSAWTRSSTDRFSYGIIGHIRGLRLESAPCVCGTAPQKVARPPEFSQESALARLSDPSGRTFCLKKESPLFLSEMP